MTAKEWLRSRTDIPTGLYGLQSIDALYRIMEAYAAAVNDEQLAHAATCLDRSCKQCNELAAKVKP